ncbi:MULTISPECIES: hypothetical protein [Jonquetella]|uniref:Uncharacterized protein n=1 Tax=Jonquetella anthropi DSM 22815 TaxID=885272 RepID=H0UMG7_9BACT|nr:MULTISPECIES: hypothetical protein [Jonquetella]EEX47669.1 hypothetical protein GCWU000246_01808 [Jonquetella anthropi E3_33 E1]EHM12640.1 hypothetical protein JonanDRAFT_0215 [Jonquetella anthropi DSM 22815]ERL24699.1 hypothetical protein HMPREF1249_1341 [Jonquetella sp. BV3C21]
MKDVDQWNRTNDEEAILRDEPLPPAEDEPIVDDEWAEFRKLSPEEQKWALIQLELDREARRTEGFLRGE